MSSEDSSHGDTVALAWSTRIKPLCFIFSSRSIVLQTLTFTFAGFTFPSVLQMALAFHNSTNTSGLPSQASDFSSVRQASDAGSMAAELDSLEDKLAFLERSRQMTLQMSALFAQEMEAAAQMEEKHCLSAASPQITGRHAPAVSGVSSTWMADISYYASKSSTTSSPSSRRSHRRRISCSGSGRILSRMQSSNSLPCPECHSM